MSLNKGPLVADIKRPEKPKPASRSSKKPKRKGLSFKRKLAILALLLFLVGASILAALDIREGAVNVYRGFKDLAADLGGFGNPEFEGSLDSIEGDLDALDQKARFLSLVPQLREVPEIIGSLREIVEIVGDLGRTFSVLRSEGISLAFEGRGEEVIEALKEMKSSLERLGSVGDSLAEKADEFDEYKDDISSISSRLTGLNENLDRIIQFLDVPGERRLVILFENPSELRPSGGFAGSYGELTLERGSVRNLEVNDIYYPDKFLTRDIIPPYQLQGITPNWGARDTNWFFDFADSSGKLLEYLEASEIYQEENTTFDGVIALNVRVVEDILRLTGPIDIPEYEMQLDHRNFLREIQEEVELKKVPGENPKEVLKFAAPALIEAVSSLEGPKKGSLLDLFLARAQNKDVKFFFRDEGLENMVSEMERGGRDYELAPNFSGDYLAVVNTNVAGGKTDVFVDQRTVLKSVIGSEGVIENELSITRKHEGGEEPEEFYNKTNQNFLRVFTVPGAALKYIEGGFQKEIKPLVSYSGSRYTVDPDLSVLEETRTLLTTPPDGYAERYRHSGKGIFGTWFNVEPGESETLKLGYSGVKIPLIDNQRFLFVLDKQSGSEMDFDYTIVAPEGFRWRESGNQIFRYREDNLPARLKIELTLRQDGN